MILRDEIDFVIPGKHYDGPITGICKYKEGYYFYSQEYSNDGWLLLDPSDPKIDLDVDQDPGDFWMPRIYGLYKMETDILAHHLYWYFSKVVNAGYGREIDKIKPDTELYKVNGIQKDYYLKFLENHFKKDKRFDIYEYQEKREDLVGFFM